MKQLLSTTLLIIMISTMISTLASLITCRNNNSAAPHGYVCQYDIYQGGHVIDTVDSWEFSMCKSYVYSNTDLYYKLIKIKKGE